MEIMTHGRQHLCHTTEVAAGVYTEEQIDGAAPGSLLECFVKSLITWVRGAPDLIFQRFVYVVLRVRFDNKEARLMDE